MHAQPRVFIDRPLASLRESEKKKKRERDKVGGRKEGRQAGGGEIGIQMTCDCPSGLINQVSGGRSDNLAVELGPPLFPSSARIHIKQAQK